MAARIPPANIEDIAYQIVAGYYPQVASNLDYKTGTSNAGIGKQGSTGAKYKLKPGWTQASIEKARFAKMNFKEKEAEELRLYGTKQGVDVEGVKGEFKRGKGKFAPFKWAESRNRGSDEPVMRYVWKGGSSNYKLYGNMVWHMHGRRKRNSLLTYLEQFGDKTPEFSQVYKDTEPQLVARAQTMAKQLFRKALNKKILNEFFEGDMGEIIKDMKADGMTIEEGGYKYGDYEYMPYSRAIGTENTPGPYRDILDMKASGSKAQLRDMVKINTKTGAVEAIMDVTEMPIDELGHGVVEVPEELTEAIDAIDPEDNESLLAVEKAVEQMFIKAIDNDYNPTIKYLKDYAKKQGMKKSDFKSILKAVQNDVKKHTGKKGSKVGVPDIAQQTGMKLADHARKGHYKKVFSEEGLKYVVHMLATMGPAATSTYLQAHRVADWANGQSVYAIVPLIQNEKTMLFKKGALKGNVEILTGHSATMAIESNNDHTFQEQSANYSKAQKRNFMQSRVNGVNNNGQMAGQCLATSSLQKSALHSTTASYVGNDALDQLFEALMAKLRADPVPVNRAAGALLRDNVYHWDPVKEPERRRLIKGAWENKTQFWALPYIGIQHSEHVE